MRGGVKKRKSKTGRSKKASVSLALALVLLLSSSATILTSTIAQIPPPTLPHSFYGKLRIDGKDATIGTVVKGYIDGEERGSVVVKKEGEYADGYYTYLQINGTDADEGKKIIFKVNGSQTNWKEIKANEEHPFSPWGVTQLNLTVTTPKIIDWYNNKTEDNTTEITVNETEAIYFNVTANMTIDVWNWSVDGELEQSSSSNEFVWSWGFCESGTHNVSVYGENKTYGQTINTVVWNVTVKDITPPASISNLTNETILPCSFQINFTWTNPPDCDFSHVMIYINGTFRENVTKPQNWYNATFFPHANITISTRTVDINGNINETWVNHTVEIPNNPPKILPINDVEVRMNKTLTINVHVSDCDNDTLCINTSDPDNITVIPSCVNDTANWTTVNLTLYYSKVVMNKPITVTVNDSYGGVNSTIFNVTTYEIGLNLTVEGNKTAKKYVKPSVNATYELRLENTGTGTDNYTLVIDNPMSANVTMSGNVTEIKEGVYRTRNVNASESILIFLNVSSEEEGIYPVNVTANSTENPAKIDYVNTTTVVDGTPPSVNITYPPEGLVTNKTQIQVNGTVSDEFSVIKSVFVTVDGAVEEVSVENGTFNTNVTLKEGLNKITVNATDDAGNTGESSINVTLDIHPPSVSITYPPEGFITNMTQIYVNGTVSDNIATIISVIVNNKTVSVVNGNFSTKYDLEEGQNTITVRAIDEAKNEGKDSVNVTRDTEAPDITINMPAPAWYRQDILVNATVTDETSGVKEVRFRWENATAYGNWIPMSISDGYYIAVLNISEIPDGKYTINVSALDNAFNLANESVEVGIDRVKPIIFNETPPNGSYIIETKPTISVSYQDPAPASGINTSAVVMLLDGEKVNATVNETTATYTPEEPLEGGLHSVTVSVRDNASNENSKTWRFTICVPPTNLTAEWDQVNETVIVRWEGASECLYDVFVATDKTFENITEKHTVKGLLWTDENATKTTLRLYRVALNGSEPTNETVGKFSITIYTGWNLISLPIIPSNTSIDAVICADMAVNGDWIYADEPGPGISWTYAYYWNGWSGNLTILEPEKGYFYNRAGPDFNLTIAGRILTDINTTIYNGWNVLGYASVMSQSLDIIPGYNGDWIYGDAPGPGISWTYAYYWDGWTGTLTNLTPGQGYLYNRAGPTFYWTYTDI